MPAYRFEALDADGGLRKGILEGDTAKAVRTQLRQQQLAPVSVQLAIEQATNDNPSKLAQFFAPKAFQGVGLAVWTRQLAGLVAAGLPLERSLTALLDEAEAPALRNLVADLRSEVNAGAPFATALAKHPREFGPIYTSVVAAGEQSGALGTVLNRLADEQESAQALKAKLLGAALYPAIVTVVAIVIVAFLVTYVVPQVAGVFAGTKNSLPLLTTIMLGIASFVKAWGWVMLGLLLAAAIALRFAWKAEATGLRLDAWWLRAPVVGRLVRGYNAARFASTLAMLSAAGLPILKALQAAADTLSNRAMRQDVLDAVVMVREGAPLAGAIDRGKKFPSLLPMFARLGEQTGQLPTMLDRAATQLSNEAQRRAVALATVLEPLLIVGMGLMVMLIVLAVLLPIIQLNTLVK
jgi:general secretion pathway protein F